MILTDDKKLSHLVENTKFVRAKSLKHFNGDRTIEIILGSRELVKTIENITLPNLKFIQLLSAGFEGIDIEKYRKNGVTVSNAANVYNVGMAEFIVYSMLMGAKRYNKSIKNGFIRYQRGYNYITELQRKTVGIMGVGAIGKEVAKRLDGFEMNIIGFDILTIEVPFFNRIYTIKDKETFLSQCDYLIVTLPLNEKTEASLDQSVFKVLKPNVTIVNVGRKALFNDKDFLKALKSNKDMSAILDMFEIFPNRLTNPYRRLSNVKVLPGITAISQEINIKRLQLIKENIDLVLSNQTPKFVL